MLLIKEHKSSSCCCCCVVSRSRWQPDSEEEVLFTGESKKKKQKDLPLLLQVWVVAQPHCSMASNIFQKMFLNKNQVCPTAFGNYGTAGALISGSATLIYRQVRNRGTTPLPPKHKIALDRCWCSKQPTMATNIFVVISKHTAIGLNFSENCFFGSTLSKPGNSRFSVTLCFRQARADRKSPVPSLPPSLPPLSHLSHSHLPLPLFKYIIGPPGSIVFDCCPHFS